MNISNFFNIRAKYFSSLESIDSENTFGETNPSISIASLDIVNTETNEPWGLNMKFQNLKSYLLYLLGIHSLEPILGVDNELIDLKRVNVDITLPYSTFINNTTVDLKYTFIFKPIKFVDSMLLAYKDPGYQGERSIYKPLGHTVNKAVDTKATLSLSEVRQFFIQHFKYSTLRGTATFSYGTFLNKGTVIELTERPMILIVTSSSLRNNGVNSYEALVLVKDD